MRRLASLVETIDFFLYFLKAIYLSCFLREKRAPLSPGEELRVRRALLRFQFYTQLVHQPEVTDEIISNRDWEQRYPFQH